MATVNPTYIERPKKSGHCGENIHDLEHIMAKKEYDNAPKVYGVHTTVISNPPVFQPAIEPICIEQSDGTVKSVIRVNEADGSSRYVSEQELDIYGRRKSKLETFIEMLPPGSICKIYLDDIGTVQVIIHRIKICTAHFEPALHIEFFKLKDVIAMPADASPDTLSHDLIMQSCVICNLGQIEIIDSSDAAEMSRELIKNEMLVIKKQIAALKDNLRRLSRLRNSRDSTSGLFSEIDRKYRLFVQSLEQKRFMKWAEPEVVL